MDIKTLSKIVKITTHRFPLYITKQYLSHYRNDAYEPYSSEIVKLLLKPNSTFIDVGGHFGYYSMLAFHAQKSTKVVIVEPFSENLFLIRKNLKINKVKNFKLFGLIASDKEKMEILRIPEASSEATLHWGKYSKVYKEEKIKSMPLDVLISDMKADFIKIDVEGHEIFVLNGLKKILSKNSDLILLIELNPLSQKLAGFTPKDLIRKIRSLKFDIFVIDESEGNYYQINSGITKEMFRRRHFYANLLCIPQHLTHWVTKLLDSRKSISNISKQLDEVKLLKEIISVKDEEARAFKLTLDKITSAKTYKVWQAYCQIRDRFHLSKKNSS